MVHTMLLAGNYIPARNLELQPLSFPHQAIHCDVVFGSPSAECRGTGICKISGTNSISILEPKKDCRTTKAVLVECPDNQGITLIFFRSLLCSQLYRHHFWKGVLTLHESCPLPTELSSQLENAYKLLLPASYSVVEESGFFKVDIDCAL